MPFTYRQVKDLYDVLKDSGAVQKSLPEWSTEMGNLTGSDLYAEGQHDNWLKRASVGVDRAIESVPGLVETSRDLGGDFGSMFGHRETGAQIGEGLPRMAANFLPMLIPGAGWGAAAARLGGMGLAQGAQTYTETGSPAAGVLSGVTAAALPKIAELGEQGVLRAMGGREVSGSIAKGFDEAGFPTAIEAVKKLFPSTVGQSIGNFVGGQGAAAIAMEGSGLAQDVLAGRPMHNPFSAETALNLTLGQLPFAALHLAGKAFGVGKGETNQADLLQAAINHTESRMKVKEATDALNAKTDIEKVPEVTRNPIVDPAVLAETNSLKEQIGALRAKQDEITSKENITPDDIEELKRATDADNALSSTGVDDITEPFQPSNSDKFEVKGKEITYKGPREGNKYRTVLTEDGRVIRYSKGKFETPPKVNADGTTSYFIPKSELWHTVLPTMEAKPNPTPDLPVQANPGPIKFDHITALDKLETSLEAAQTPADYQKSVVALNAIRETADLSPVSSKQLDRIEAKLTQLGSKNPRKDAIKAQTAKAKRQVEAISAEEQAALQHKKEQAEFYGHERTGLENQQRAAVAKGQDAEAGASTSGTKRTSNGLQPVLSIPKWDGATEPIHNFLDEVMSGTLAAKLDAQDSFVQWQKTSGDKDTPLGIEGERFKRLWIMEAEGKLEGKATLSENEAKLFNDELNSDGIGVEDYRTLMDFPERDHVLNWLDAVNEKIDSIKAKNERAPDPEPFAPREIEAQGGLTLGDPSRAPREPEPFVPQTEAQMVEAQNLSGDGHGLLAPLLESENPVTKAIASEWVAKFPQLLANIQSRVADSAGSYTQAGELGVSRITFDSSVVGMSKNAQELLKLHEVAHGLTLHLLNSLPPEHPLIRQLESIRQRAIEALPKNLRKMYEEALASNWMERNRADDTATVWKELADTTENRNILYALMDNKELTAQAYNSPAFRKYMQGVTGKTGLWKSFVKWSKELLGIGEKVHDNAFGELIETTHQLMEQGEYLATVREFGERYFEGQGKGGTYGQQQTQRALNLIAESLQGISRDELHQSLGMGEDRFNVALTKAKANLEGKLAERGEDFESVSGLMDELGHDPSVRGVDDFVESNLADGKDVTHAMDLMPQAASKYIFQKLADHKDVLEMIRAATDQKNEAMVNIANPEFLRGPVAGALKAIDHMLGQEARQTAFAQQLVGLNAVDPQGFLEASAAAPKAVEDFMEGGKAVLGKAGSSIANFLEPLGQLSRRVPEAAEAISKGFQLQANIRKMFSDVIKPMGIDQSSEYLDPNPTKDSVAESVKVFQSDSLTRKVDKWMFLNNKEGKDAVTMLPASHPEIAKLLYGLSDADKKAVTDVVMKAGKVTQVLNAKKLEKMREIAAVNGAGVVMADMGGKTKDAIALSDTLLGAVLKMKDPMTAWQGQAEIANVEKRMEAEPFLNLLRFAQGEAEKIGLWKEYFDKNPFWATAQRTERYLIKAFRNGKPVTYQASSTAEAKEITAKYKLSLREPFVDQWKGKEDEPFAAPNMGAETVARMQQLEENQIAMLKKAGVLVTEEDVNAFRRSSVASQVIRESAQSLQGVKEPPRLLGQGADEIPWMWNHITHAQRESTYWSRQLLRAQARTYLRDSELASNEPLRKQLATHFENLLSPDPIAAQKMTKFAATWFMGFNLASVLINAAQPFTTHVSELTAITGKPIDSYRRTLDALKETAGSAFTKKEWSTPEVERFMKDAAADGERGLSMFDDDAAAQESIVTNYKRAMTKHKTQSLGQRLETASGAYSTAAMWVFKHGEQLNSTAALLASFKLYREQGLGFEEAKAKAYEFNHAVNFSGGRAQRPVGAFSGQGAFPRTVAMLGTSLQSYVLGTTFQIARYLQRGGFRPEGLKPHEVFAARKAAIQMLGTQFAAAGLLGMPFVSGAISLLDKLFPDLELNRKIREGVSGLLSSDAENGSALTDIAMTGVPSMLGWDLQSRLSMGNTLPGVSEVNGFQAENLMGPIGNIVKNFVGGVQGWSQGDLAGGTQKFLPPVVKKLTEVGSSFLNDGGEIRDYQRRPLEKPSAGEQLGRLIGFQPKRLSDQNAAARIATQASEVQNRRTAEENSDLAKEVLKGNFGTVRAQLLEKSRGDTNYNPLDAVRSISRAAEELKFPRDLRREGNLGTSTTRTSLLNSYSNLTPVGGSEVERLQFRVGVEQRLGFPPQNLRGDLAMAQMMDQLKAAKPGATRVELRAAAQLALRRASTSRQMLPSQEE